MHCFYLRFPQCQTHTHTRMPENYALRPPPAIPETSMQRTHTLQERQGRCACIADGSSASGQIYGWPESRAAWRLCGSIRPRREAHKKDKDKDKDKDDNKHCHSSNVWNRRRRLWREESSQGVAQPASQMLCFGARTKAGRPTSCHFMGTARRFRGQKPQGKASSILVPSHGLNGGRTREIPQIAQESCKART